VLGRLGLKILFQFTRIVMFLNTKLIKFNNDSSEELWDALRSKENFIFLCNHQDILGLISFMLKGNSPFPNRNVVFLTSDNQGKYLGKLLKGYGYEYVARRRDDHASVKAAIKKLDSFIKDGYSVAIVLDQKNKSTGAIHSRRQISRGAIWLSNRHKLDILAFTISLPIKITIPSTWDYFEIPLIFTIGTIQWRHYKYIKSKNGRDHNILAHKISDALVRYKRSALAKIYNSYHRRKRDAFKYLSIILFIFEIAIIANTEDPIFKVIMFWCILITFLLITISMRGFRTYLQEYSGQTSQQTKLLELKILEASKKRFSCYADVFSHSYFLDDDILDTLEKRVAEGTKCRYLFNDCSRFLTELTKYLEGNPEDKSKLERLRLLMASKSLEIRKIKHRRFRKHFRYNDNNDVLFDGPHKKNVELWDYDTFLARDQKVIRKKLELKFQAAWDNGLVYNTVYK